MCELLQVMIFVLGFGLWIGLVYFDCPDQMLRRYRLGIISKEQYRAFCRARRQEPGARGRWGRRLFL